MTSLFSDRTGFRSFPGATWREGLIRNMNSGFGQGAPTNEYRAVQEGREGEGFLPLLRGVGRLGRGPISVLQGMADAMKEEREFKNVLGRLAEFKSWMDVI